LSLPSYQVFVYYDTNAKNTSSQDAVLDRLRSYEGASDDNVRKLITDPANPAPDVITALQTCKTVELLEFVGDGQPNACSGFSLTDVPAIGNFISSQFTNAPTVILNGCNTGNWDQGTNITEMMAAYTGRPTGGLVGFGTWGTYIESLRNKENLFVDVGGINHTDAYIGSGPPLTGAMDADDFECYRLIDPSRPAAGEFRHFPASSGGAQPQPVFPVQPIRPFAPISVPQIRVIDADFTRLLIEGIARTMITTPIAVPKRPTAPEVTFRVDAPAIWQHLSGYDPHKPSNADLQFLYQLQILRHVASGKAWWFKESFLRSRLISEYLPLRWPNRSFK